MTLNDPIRLVAGRSGFDERQQDRLGKHQTMARFQIANHPVGKDHETPEQSGHSTDHIMGEVG